jgi:hypothetical protein
LTQLTAITIPKAFLWIGIDYSIVFKLAGIALTKKRKPKKT